MRFLTLLLLVTLACFGPDDSDVRSDGWPGWRGPGGLGAAPEADLPLEWGPEHNVLWKAPIAGRGHSSPVVWAGRVFVTTAVEGPSLPDVEPPLHMRDGFYDENPEHREPYLHPDSVGGDRRHRLQVLAFDATSGAPLWERTAWDGPVFDNRHKQGSYASATPVTDGERLFAWFGSEGLYAYDLDGELLWSYDPGELPNWGLGHGASPVVHDGAVFLLCDRDNGDDSFLVALDARTGRELWRTEREVRTGWSTPLVVSSGVRTLLVVSGFQWSMAYDAGTGEEVWRAPGLRGNVIATPVADGERVYLSVGYPDKLTQAVDLDSSGLVEPDDVTWRYAKGTAYVPSNLLLGGHLYLISDNGTLTCLDAATGEVVYQGGRVPVPTRFGASPVAWGDRILLSGQDGDMFVIRAGPRHEVLASNSIGESIWASPAIAGNRLYVRGDRHLFAIGTP